MANKAIVGEKVGMTQVWDDDNQVIPVTVLRVRPNRVVQVKTQERDGYSALQITFGEKDIEKMKQPEAGHFANSGVVPGSRLVELRVDDVADYQVGQEITVDEMAEIGRVDVTSVSKGKGFAGAMKRHGFAGLPASHGAHKVHRKPGAVGHVLLHLEYLEENACLDAWETRKQPFLICRLFKQMQNVKFYLLEVQYRVQMVPWY